MTREGGGDCGARFLLPRAQPYIPRGRAAAWSQPANFTIGDGGRVEPDLRGFTFWNESMTFMKRTYIPAINEACNVEFRSEFFNLTNRVVFSNPASNLNNTNTFGVVSGQANSPRTIQFGLKFNF